MKKKQLVIALAIAMLCSITACSSEEKTNGDIEETISTTEASNDDKEVTSEKDNNATELESNDETSSNIDEPMNDSSTQATEVLSESIEATTTIEASTTKKEEETTKPSTQVTTETPTTTKVETQTTTKAATEPTTKKPTEQETTTEPTTTHTHDWKAVMATRTIEGYYEEIWGIREHITLEEYHDCEECGYIDLDEAVDLWNEDASFHNHADKASHLFSMDTDLVEPYLRKCIKRVGTADLSTHKIADCAGSWLYDENGLVEDENGSPIWTYTTIEHKEDVYEMVDTIWHEPTTEEYIDHYECSCGATK